METMERGLSVLTFLFIVKKLIFAVLFLINLTIE